MTVNRGLPVNLPKAASSQRDLRESVNITVTREGDIFLNKEPVTLQEIGQRVQAGLKRDPELLALHDGCGELRAGDIHPRISAHDQLRPARDRPWRQRRSLVVE